MNGGFCLICSHHYDSFDGLTSCPNCGDTEIPCGDADQVTISINVHELRILCIWAENWCHKQPQDNEEIVYAQANEEVVYAIARRIKKQLRKKDICLTMADGFEALKKAGFNFTTNHPAGDIP